MRDCCIFCLFVENILHIAVKGFVTRRPIICVPFLCMAFLPVRVYEPLYDIRLNKTNGPERFLSRGENKLSFFFFEKPIPI